MQSIAAKGSEGGSVAGDPRVGGGVKVRVPVGRPGSRVFSAVGPRPARNYGGGRTCGVEARNSEKDDGGEHRSPHHAGVPVSCTHFAWTLIKCLPGARCQRSFNILTQRELPHILRRPNYAGPGGSAPRRRIRVARAYGSTAVGDPIAAAPMQQWRHG